MRIKHYLVFGPVVGSFMSDGFRNEIIVDLEAVGLVKAKDNHEAIAVAKSRGFKTPIVQEKHREKDDVEFLESTNAQTTARSPASRHSHEPARRNGYTRKS